MNAGLNLSDFLDLTPVEFDVFLHVRANDKKCELENMEHLVRLINTFIVNSNPYLKKGQHIKDPAKLYKISSEVEHYEEQVSNVKYAKLSQDEYKDLAEFLNNLN